ncbi:hypothetical protein N9937_00075 [bacterium]|nr:hypothetical protein [bacterium]
MATVTSRDSNAGYKPLEVTVVIENKAEYDALIEASNKLCSSTLEADLEVNHAFLVTEILEAIGESIEGKR